MGAGLGVQTQGGGGTSPGPPGKGTGERAGLTPRPLGSPTPGSSYLKTRESKC